MKLNILFLITIKTLIILLGKNVLAVKTKSRLLLSKKEGNLLKSDKTKTSSFIIEARPGKASLVNLKQKGSTLGYSFGMAEKEFVITAFNRKTINIDNTDDHKIVFGGRSISATSLSLYGSIKYAAQNQWRMVLHDTFAANNTVYQGWDYSVVTQCGMYYSIFGGVCQLGSKEIKKDILTLPPHRMVKIEVNYHFIGNWQGETGYLKLNTRSFKKDLAYLWTYRCSRKKEKSKLYPICGYDVCKLNHPVSVTIQHIDPTISLSFGSSLSNNLPCDRSYGISDFRVYIQ